MAFNMRYQPTKIGQRSNNVSDENALQKMRQLISSARNNNPKAEFARKEESSPSSAFNQYQKKALGVRSMNMDISDKK